MDLNINKLNLDKLLGSDCNLNHEQKKFFRALAEAFEERQNDAFDIIAKNTLDALKENSTKNTSDALKENSNCFPIVTTILNGKTEADFFSVLSQEELKNNIVFICDRIENIPEEDKFECCGYKFQLVRTDIYIEKEKMLANMFRIYNIRLPYCFSPYARRAFFINIWDENKQEYIPYDYKKNDLRDRIRSENENIIFGSLYWNIEQISVEKSIRPKDIPSRDGVDFVRFEDCDENTYICTDAINDAKRDERKSNTYISTSALNDAVKVERASGEKNKYIDIYREDYEKYRPQLTKVQIYNVDGTGENRFANIYDRILPTPTRAITKADIALIVNKFYPLPDEYKGVEGHITNNKTIKEYVYKYRYVYEDISSISARNKNYCYLCFEDSGVDKFFEDRVNFFISFMRYCYPNFYWVGVRK